jgi:hypothetical protein
MPTLITKLDTPVQIPLPIAFNLCFPELRIGFRKYIIFTSFMSVPEASVHKNASTVFLQYDVGRTRESLYMDTETVSVSEKEFPHDYLWLRVLATDTCHAPVALFGSEFIWHHKPPSFNIIFFLQALHLRLEEGAYIPYTPSSLLVTTRGHGHRAH